MLWLRRKKPKKRRRKKRSSENSVKAAAKKPAKEKQPDDVKKKGHESGLGKTKCVPTINQYLALLPAHGRRRVSNELRTA